MRGIVDVSPCLRKRFYQPRQIADATVYFGIWKCCIFTRRRCRWGKATDRVSKHIFTIKRGRKLTYYPRAWFGITMKCQQEFLFYQKTIMMSDVGTYRTSSIEIPLLLVFDYFEMLLKMSLIIFLHCFNVHAMNLLTFYWLWVCCFHFLRCWSCV